VTTTTDDVITSCGGVSASAPGQTEGRTLEASAWGSCTAEPSGFSEWAFNGPSSPWERRLATHLCLTLSALSALSPWKVLHVALLGDVPGPHLANVP